MSQFDNVSVVKQANVYFDGKCVSHTVQFADGTKKTVGVILPAAGPSLAAGFRTVSVLGFSQGMAMAAA